jgi:S1-C subfamily serine protease
MRHRFLGAAVLLLAAGVSLSGSQAQPASGAGSQAGGPRYKLLRSVSGTKGSTENGRFVVDDPRTVFYVPDDKQLVFYFEWEGPPARHRLEGVWTDPTGKVASVSAFDYEAVERRFGARWSLPVGAGMALGTWSFDVRVDGEAAGRHSFQIVEGGRPADLPVARRPLSAADAYRRLQTAVLFVDAIDQSGGVAATGLGFALGPNRVVTAFETVDGAASVRVRFPDGASADVRELAAFNRWQDWAVLPVATGALQALPQAATPAWQVGDHVYSVARSADGGLTLVDASIMGTARPERAGERITVTAAGLGLSSGAPVLNEFGDVVAMIADQAVPGTSTLPRPMSGPSATDPLQAKPGVYSVGIEQVQSARDAVPAMTFAQLTKDGVFTPRLAAGRTHVARATTAHGVQKEPNWFNPIDESAEFPRAASSLAVVLNLRPRAKLKLLANCQVLDTDGRKLGEGKPVAVKADVKDTPAYAWQIPLAAIPPGLYRVEIVFDGAPVWRTFVRITE